MGWRYRSSVRLARGLRINLSRSGASLSVGRRGATVNLGRRGIRGTVGLPGSGIGYSEAAPWRGRALRPAIPATLAGEPDFALGPAGAGVRMRLDHGAAYASETRRRPIRLPARAGASSRPRRSWPPSSIQDFAVVPHRLCPWATA